MVSDGEYSDSLTITVDVTPVNDPPIITSPNVATATEDIYFDYLIEITDVDSDNITVEVDNLPDWLNHQDDNVYGTPQENDINTFFRIIAFDGELYDTLEVNINVIEVNDPPQIININDLSFSKNETFEIDLDSCFTDPDNIASEMNWQVWSLNSCFDITQNLNIVSFSSNNEACEDSVWFIVTDLEELADTLAIKLRTIIPDGTLSYKDSEISIFPNPASDFIFIKGIEPQNQEISIFSIDGRIMIKENIKHLKVNLSSLNTGTYLFTINENSSLVKIKLVKK